MIQKSQDGLNWLLFDLLRNEKDVVHGVFTRKGGVSSGAFDSLNMSVFVGDQEDNVQTNMNKVKEALGITYLRKPKLIHGADIGKINEKDEELYGMYDAVMTNCLDVGVMITHADCQAAVFYDPINKVIANAHAGWRGSVLNIYEKVIAALKTSYGSDAKNLLVCISPSLGPDDAQFLNYKTELPESFWEYQVKPFYFDFWAISKMQLMQCGVLPHHIEIAGISTYSHSDFFSHRRDKPTGRNGTVIALKG